MLEMNGLTNRFVNKFVSEIEKKDVWGPIVVPGIVYNLIIDLVPPEIQKVLVTGIPKKDEEYGACIELGPQAVSRLFNQIVQEIKNNNLYKEPVSGKTGKEAAKDVPSWAKGNRPYKEESGNDFAKRLCDEKYGINNYKKGPGTEYNKIRKWGDRGFK